MPSSMRPRTLQHRVIENLHIHEFNEIVIDTRRCANVFENFGLYEKSEWDGRDRTKGTMQTYISEDVEEVKCLWTCDALEKGGSKDRCLTLLMNTALRKQKEFAYPKALSAS